MKGIPFIGTLCILLLTPGCTESVKKAAEAPAAGVAVSPMQIGISYYPEQRPRESWNEDFDLLVEAGIKRIRIGEFAWSTLEPGEGQFDFQCFDDCIELAQRYGIQVVMCTPTAAPPVWLVEKHPEILPVNADKQRNTFGGRQHRCYNAPAYEQYTRIIVHKLSARYAHHPNVVAWQIDNEMGGEQKRCYCDFCRDSFQLYLAERYVDVATLNKRWGNAFWSLDYQQFGQVTLPYRYNATLMLKHHPSLELEFSRFSSASIIRYCNMQASIIREYNPQALVTTNQFAYEWGDNLNSFELNLELDAAGFDLYTTQKHQLAFYADLNRSLNSGPNWIMEYGTDTPDLYAEMELLESRGVEWLYFFKLNPFPAGMEQSPASLLTITGGLTKNFQVIKAWNHNLEERRTVIMKEPETGLFYDFDCSWALAQEGWGSYRENLVYQACVIDTIYRALYAPGNPVRIFHTPGQFQKVKRLILPQQVIHRPELESAVLQFIHSGGTVITTHNLFMKNTDNVYLTRTPDIYEKVMNRPGEFFVDTPVESVEYSYGKGKLIVVPGDAGCEAWRRILRSI
ncbi:MAG: beta-galactosidase [Bacteroidales bacterium]